MIHVPANGAANPLFDSHFGRPPQKPSGAANVGPGQHRVGRVTFLVLDLRRLSHRFLDDTDDIVERHGPVAAQIYRFISLKAQRRHRSTGNVVHIGKVPLLRSVAVHRNWLTLGNAAGEPEYAHIRASARSVDSEVTQRHGVNAIKVMVRVQQGFGCLLGGGVGRKRSAGMGLLTDRAGRRITVDAGG